MGMTFEQPWFLLLWIVLLLILAVPIIVAGFTTAANGYFKAKEQHISRLAAALGRTLEKEGEQLKKAVQSMTGERKENDGD